MAPLRDDFRGGSRKRAVVSETVSPERRSEQQRTSPLAFSAAPHRHRLSKRDRERRRHQRRRREGRSRCSETVDDSSFFTRRPLEVQSSDAAFNAKRNSTS